LVIFYLNRNKSLSHNRTPITDAIKTVAGLRRVLLYSVIMRRLITSKTLRMKSQIWPFSTRYL